LGHVFKLGEKYSQVMKAEYLDQDGHKKPLLMGCYGIGLGRLVAAIVEANHDNRGMIWPATVAPFDAYLIGVDRVNQANRVNRVDRVNQELKKAGVEVLYDDREVSAGVKFADADLIGIPVRLVVSAKTGDKIEWKKRGEKKSQLLSLEEIIQSLKK